MSQLIDPRHGLELRDAAGSVLGNFVPRGTLEELIAEREELRKRLAAVEAERDTYLQALYALKRQEVKLTAEERAELDKNGVPAEQVMDEIQRIVSSAAQVAKHG